MIKQKGEQFLMINKGILFDIQRFSLNDGPGIRTTLFFKGCSLRCRWCHNPESISPRIQLSHNPKKCILCGKCVEYVKGNGIEIIEGELKIDFCKHDQSFDLIDVCPMKAYNKNGKEYTADELIEVILKDKDFYDNSNGGVTFSGGEAINQIDFICEIGYKLKKLGIQICLDISGYNPNNNIEKTLEFVDEYLLDYKLTDITKFKDNIGLEFDFHRVIKLINDNDKNIILRCPIIPGVNDTEEHFKAICDVSNKYENIKQVDILPYHNLVKVNKFKYINNPTKYEVPSEENKAKWKECFKENALKNGIIENERI